MIISHDRWFLDRVATHVLAFEGDSQVTWFEGNFEAYEEHRRELLGAAADRPHASPTSASCAATDVTTRLFDRDTAVERRGGSASQAVFAADVSADWRAGRGPHGGYLAAMLLRALIETVADAARAPRSLTIHYPRAPAARSGEHSHSTRARGTLAQHAIGANGAGGRGGRARARGLLGPVEGAGDQRVEMPGVAGAGRRREPGTLRHVGAPPFTRHLVFQPRIGTPPFTGSEQPMEVGGWLGLATPRPIDALSLAFFSDALFPPPFIRLSEPAVSPTIDLTIHFRTGAPRRRARIRTSCASRAFGRAPCTKASSRRTASSGAPTARSSCSRASSRSDARASTARRAQRANDALGVESQRGGRDQTRAGVDVVELHESSTGECM